MSVVLYHHPFTRAANVVWMLEEVGVDYELRFVLSGGLSVIQFGRAG